MRDPEEVEHRCLGRESIENCQAFLSGCRHLSFDGLSLSGVLALKSDQDGGDCGRKSQEAGIRRRKSRRKLKGLKWWAVVQVLKSSVPEMGALRDAPGFETEIGSQETRTHLYWSVPFSP